MTRKQKIWEYIQENTSNKPEGFTTSELVQVLGLVRSNVSKELNELVRENLLVKTSGRPVRYLLDEKNSAIQVKKRQYERISPRNRRIKTE